MDSSRLVVIFVLVAIWKCAETAVPRVSDNATTTDIINLLRRNARHIAERPGEASGKPDVISLSFYISGVRRISEIGNEVVYDMYFRSTWMDPRLQYEGGPPAIVLKPDEGQKYFWFPDLFFSNAHDVKIHEVRDPTTGVWLKRNGQIRVSSRLSLTAYCAMDLYFFPRDSNKCGFKVESYMYTADDVVMEVTDAQMSHSITTPHEVDELVSEVQQEVLSSGTFTSVAVTVKLTRIATHYMLLVYLPCGVLTVLTTLLFWLPPSALLERVLYGSFMLLAITPIMLGSQYNTPAVGYLKAIDVWVVGHFMFVAVAVLEVLVINLVFGRVLKANVREGDQIELVPEGHDASAFVGVKLGRLNIPVQTAWKIDLALRVIYPAAYVLFNAIFWAKY